MREVNFYAYETYCMVRIEERPDGPEVLSACRMASQKCFSIS